MQIRCRRPTLEDRLAWPFIVRGLIFILRLFETLTFGPFTLARGPQCFGFFGFTSACLQTPTAAFVLPASALRSPGFTWSSATRFWHFHCRGLAGFGVVAREPELGVLPVRKG